MAADGIGARVLRKEDRRFLTGAGHYTDDIQRPGQTYLHIVRSPHAHARIRAIRAEAARAALLSMERMRAWAKGERRMCA